MSEIADFAKRWKKRQESDLLLLNCRIIDDSHPEDQLFDVYIQGGVIKHISPATGTRGSTAQHTIDVKERYLMPGLCDAHVHCTADTADLPYQLSQPESLTTARAVSILKGMLLRGFTTVRDCGGADWGISQAVEEGTIIGPRLLFTGHALSQTGGHGDMRGKGEDCFACGAALRGIGRVCDGVGEVRKAARDELRKGAHCIKIMASGGVSSPTDRLSNCQFSLEELRAIVEEAGMQKTYACAHAYMPDAIQRALECGVRSIEHGNYLDAPTAALMATNKAFLVPTLVTYVALRENGLHAGMKPELVVKVGDLVESGLESISIARQAGVKMAFGSDLLGDLHPRQLQGLSIMQQVLSAEQVLQTATTNAAELFNMSDKIGRVAEGYVADLLVVKENPTSAEGLEALAQQKAGNLSVIVKEGVVVVG